MGTLFKILNVELKKRKKFSLNQLNQFILSNKAACKRTSHLIFLFAYQIRENIAYHIIFKH